MVERGCEALGTTEGPRWTSLCLQSIFRCKTRGTGEKGAFSGLSLPVQKTSLRTKGYGDQLVGSWNEGVGGQGCHGRAGCKPRWYGCRVLEGRGTGLRSTCLVSEFLWPV